MPQWIKALGRGARSRETTWLRFCVIFMTTFAGGLSALFLFIVLVGPYGATPLSLPIDRAVMDDDQRLMHPLIISSGHFDSIIIGSSTGMLLDPQILDGPFGSRFANLSMRDASAWEQQELINLYLRRIGPPKVLVIALDTFIWCDAAAAGTGRIRWTTPDKFPDWLYDDNRWKSYLYMLNEGAARIALRIAEFDLGLRPAERRLDGFDDSFLPPESEYDPAKALAKIHNERQRASPGDLAPDRLSAQDKQNLSFPALAWLDQILAALPTTTIKVLAYMPQDVAELPAAGTTAAASDAECMSRIASIGAARGAKVIDWAIPSPITTVDANFWDALHYRRPIADRIAHELAAAILEGRDSADYQWVVH